MVQPLRSVDGNEIYNFNVNPPVSLNDSSSDHQKTNETQSDVNPIEYFIKTKDTNKESVWQAIDQQNLNAVDYFIRIKEIDPNKLKDGYRRTLLHRASFCGNLEIVKYLMSKGADINARDKDSNLPLHLACKKGKLEIVKYFISELKMDPNLKGYCNLTCLHYASKNSDLEMMKYLVSKGAKVKARDCASNLPLHNACFEGKLEIVKYFISVLKMNPNSKGWNNDTCLHKAVYSKNLKVVKFLVENGAKKSLRKKTQYDQKTPLELAEASRNGNKELIEYLKRKMNNYVMRKLWSIFKLKKP